MQLKKLCQSTSKIFNIGSRRHIVTAYTHKHTLVYLSMYTSLYFHQNLFVDNTWCGGLSQPH